MYGRDQPNYGPQKAIAPPPPVSLNIKNLRYTLVENSFNFRSKLALSFHLKGIGGGRGSGKNSRFSLVIGYICYSPEYLVSKWAHVPLNSQRLPRCNNCVTKLQGLKCQIQKNLENTQVWPKLARK